ncbi:hypothetical protein TRVL_07982 [Trypanosoma vivax]|nr:hypothetical protein TRVL_07982 [Trypanosoma vivax]
MSDVTFTTKTSEADISKFPLVDSLDDFSKVLTDYGSAFSDFSCFKKELIESISLPTGTTLLDVFKMCFDDDASLLTDYHADRGDTDQKWEAWRPALSGSPTFSGQRKFTCTTTVKFMMHRKCAFTEYQRYAFLNVDGCEPTLLVQFSGQAEGVMFTDSFRAETLLIFKESDCIVNMRVLGYVQFLRSVWVKTKIENASLDEEMPACYRRFVTMLIERLRYHVGSTEMGNNDAPQVPEEVIPPDPPHKSKEQPVSVSFPMSFRGAMDIIVYIEFVLTVIIFLCCAYAVISILFFSIPFTRLCEGYCISDSKKNGSTSVRADIGSPWAVLLIILFDMLRPVLAVLVLCFMLIMLSVLKRTLESMK